MDRLKMLDWAEQGISSLLYLLVYLVFIALGGIVTLVFGGFLYSLLIG
ncbi:hypothetical protein [Limimonas halophila]|nr:hypothetical protein [Limimonas halophila]